MLSKYMPITLLILCFGFNFTGCKRANSKLANNELSCSSEELSQLKARLAQLQSQSVASVTGSRTLQGQVTERKKLASDFAMKESWVEQSLDMALSGRSGWEEHMAKGCNAYSLNKAEELCRRNKDCYSYWGFGSIDKSGDRFLAYRQQENRRCAETIRGYVERNATQAGIADQAQSQDSTEGAGQQERDNIVKQIRDLKAQIFSCQRLIHKQKMRDKESQAIVRQETEVETEESAEEWLSEDSIPQIPDAPGDAEVEQDVQTSDDRPQGGSGCSCVFQNGRCHKMVGGAIVASLTPINNQVTGRQEVCQPGGGGGYDNLCNQPQLKCP